MHWSRNSEKSFAANIEFCLKYPRKFRIVLVEATASAAQCRMEAAEREMLHGWNPQRKRSRLLARSDPAEGSGGATSQSTRGRTP